MGWGVSRKLATAALAAAVMMAGCTSSPRQEEPSPTLSETAASQAPTVPLGAAFVRSDLEVRADPAQPPFTVIEPFNAYDERGVPVYVWSGPVHQSGSDWYRIQFSYLDDWPVADTQSIFGWVSGVDAATALVPAPADCPLDAPGLASMADETRLQCAGSSELTLAGVISSSAGGQPPYVGSPPWLTGKAYFLVGGTSGFLPIHLPHSERLWRQATSLDVRGGAEVQVVGHFDDQAASGCTLEPRLEGFVAMSAAEQEQWCRQRFVVSDIAIVGVPRWSPEPGWSPPPGVQPVGGDGWRLLGSANQPQIAIVPGDAVDAALDQQNYEILWWGMGLPGEPPAVDFDQEIVVRFITGVSGTCPWIVFDGVGVDLGDRLVYGMFSYPSELPSPRPGVTYGCTTDWRPHGFLVAISRDMLPGDRFTLRLKRDRICVGCGSDLDQLEVSLSE